MDFTIGTAALAAELALLDKVVSRRPTIPVLGGVRLDASAGSLALAGTDTEIALAAVVEASVAAPGEALVPAQKLYEMTRSLPKGDVRIQRDETAVKLTAAGFSARLSAWDPVDFPSLPAAPNGSGNPVGRVALREVLRRTRFAVSDSDKRFFMAGTLLELHKDSIRMVGTDGHRLALADAPSTGTAEGETAIVPRKTLDVLAGLLDDGPDAVDVSVGENHLFFAMGPRVFVSRKVDGEFAAYRRVIPNPYDHKLGVSGELFSDALRRAALVASTSTKAITLALAAGTLTVAAESADVGSAHETLAAAYDGPAVKVGMNWSYLQDFLDAAGSGDVIVEAKDEVSTVRFTATSGGVNYLYALMPVRLGI